MINQVEVQGDSARQAVSSLKGYAYQLYESALAWVSLSDDEFLFLEVAEDYAIATSNALQAVQVKNTKTAITLNSQEVIETINSFFELSKGNPEKIIAIKHLTTAAIGKEKKKSDRIEGQSGLEYWKIAQAGADIEPLRKRLLKLDLSKDAIQFLKASTVQQIRDDFVNRIEWLSGAKDLEKLRQELSNRLVYLGEGKNVSSAVCDDIVDPLISRMLSVASSGGSRRLERADFIRFFDERSRISLPISAIEKMMGAVAPTLGSSSHGFVSSVAVLRPIAVVNPEQLAARPILIDRIQRMITQQKFVWLHGATGTGKSSLSKLVAREDGEGWYALQLRSLSSRDTTEVLYRASSQIAIDKPKSVVLDDLGSLANGLVNEAFIHLVETARKASVSVFVTSNIEPPHFILSAVNIISDCSIKIGNLTEDEIATFVSTKDGNTDQWSHYIYLATGGGQPLLVDAMVRGLQVQAWSVQELQQLNAILGTNKDIEKIKSEIRQRLFDELPPDESGLLVRLSTVIGTFDRKVALFLGELDPVIEMPGKVFENLIGAWIEVESEDRYRLSSLISNVGRCTLGENAVEKLNHAMASYYTKDLQLDADRFDDIVLHGIRGKNEKALTVVSLAVISANAEDVELIAKFTTNSIAFRTDRPLYSKNLKVSLFLRIAQVLLLVSSKLPEKFQDALSAFERESVGIGSVAANEHTYSMIYTKALSLPGLVDVVEDFSQFALTAAEHGRKLNISISKTETQTMGPVSSLDGYLQFMFAFQLTQISDVKTLQRVMRSLISKTKDQRVFLLKGFDEGNFDKGHIIKATWVKTLEETEVADDGYAEEYMSLARELSAADETEFAMAAFESAAIIWDEYLNDSEHAIASLEEAMKLLGENQVAVRALSRIFFHKQDYERQLEIGEPISETFNGGSTEASFFFRELAIGNSNLNKHDTAKALYINAHDRIERDPKKEITPMAAGLLADAAVEAHWSGNDPEAVKLFAQSLKVADRLNPEDDLQSATVIRLVAHSVFSLSLQVKGKENPDGEHALVSGANSNLTPHKGLEGVIKLPLDYIWYVLADTEAALDVECGVIEKLISKDWSKRAVLVSELTFHVSIARSAQRRLSRQDYLLRLPREIDAMVFGEIKGPDLMKRELTVSPRKRLPRLKAKKFAQHRGSYAQKVMTFTVRLAFLRSPKMSVEFVTKAQALERPLITRDMLDAFLCGKISPASGEVALSGIVGSVVKTLADNQSVSVVNLLLICLRLLELMENEYFEPDAIVKGKEWMLDQWKTAVEDQAFQLSSPLLAQTALSELEKRSGSKLADIADLILTLIPYVKVNPVQAYLDWLTEIRSREYTD